MDGTPPADPMLDRLVELILARGAFEAGGAEPTTATAERADRTRALAAAVEVHLGEEALTALGRSLARRIELAARGESEESPALLGDFRRQLDRHGVTREGALVAPPIVVRALAAARVATLLQMEPTRFMDEAEEKAYFAWAALRPGEEGRDLRAFGDAGWARHDPVRAAEARAYFAFEDGRYEEAGRLYRSVHEATGELRARNHSLAAVLRAEIPEASF